jgi:hypothetical protein
MKTNNQTFNLPEGEYSPGKQLLQLDDDVAPVTDEYFPSGQSLQEVALSEDAYFPSGH